MKKRWNFKFLLLSNFILPTMIIAPVLLFIFSKYLGISLIFPVYFDANYSSIMLRSIIPALVLLLASGVLVQIPLTISCEYNFWSKKTFTTVIQAYGGKASKQISKLVIFKSVLDTWEKNLPWFFSELIIIECLFNSPGLGLKAWNLAKVKNYEQLFQTIFVLGLIYVILSALVLYLTKSLGRKLDSYV